jgi:hypothetical protein
MLNLQCAGILLSKTVFSQQNNVLMVLSVTDMGILKDEHVF